MDFFKAVYGSHHILEPLGYGVLRKKIKRGARVRSAKEQFMIHSLACDFQHQVLRFTRPILLESPSSYIMEQVYEHQIVPADCYSQVPELYVALMQFQQYMAEHGYWPWKYTILYCGTHFVLCDFSLFGSIDRDRVRFPNDSTLWDINNIEERFPLALKPSLAPVAPKLETIKEEAECCIDPVLAMYDSIALELEKIDELSRHYMDP